MNLSTISTSRPLSPPLIELRVIDYLPRAPQNDPQRLMGSQEEVSQEERAKPVAEQLLASPSLSQHNNPDTEHPLNMAQNHPEPVLDLLPLTADKRLEYQKWLELAKNRDSKDKEPLETIQNIQNPTIKLKLLYEVAKGTTSLPAYLRLEAANAIKAVVDSINNLENTDPDTDSYTSLKNEAYRTLAMDPDIKEGDILLKALNGIDDYDLQQQAFEHFAKSESLDATFKQNAFLAIVDNEHYDDRLRYCAAKYIQDDTERDQALYRIVTFTNRGRLSTYILIQALNDIQNHDVKDTALKSISMGGKLFYYLDLEALKAIQDADRKEKTCIATALCPYFSIEHRLEVAKLIEDESKKDEVLIALIGLDTPINACDLRFKVEASEAIVNTVKYPKLKQDILQKFFSQSLEPDDAGQQAHFNCSFVFDFLKNIRTEDYPATDRDIQSIILNGCILYFRGFCKYFSTEGIEELIENLYINILDEDLKKDFMYALLQHDISENKDTEIKIYIYILQLILPARITCNAAIDDLIDKVLSKERCSVNLCLAVLLYLKHTLYIKPSLKESLIHVMIENSHLDKDFRIKIVNSLRKHDKIDEAEKEKLLQTIQTGQDNRRFKRMKVVHNDE